MKEFKLKNNETIKDYVQYRKDYKVLDELTKDEIIERYIYKLDRAPFRGFLTGVIIMGIAFILFRAIDFI
jgi:hypothetical protein